MIFAVPQFRKHFESCSENKARKQDCNRPERKSINIETFLFKSFGTVQGVERVLSRGFKVPFEGMYGTSEVLFRNSCFASINDNPASRSNKSAL